MATKKSRRSAAPSVKTSKTSASKKSSARKAPARKASATRTSTRKTSTRKSSARKPSTLKEAVRGLKERVKGGRPVTSLGHEVDISWMKTWPRIVARAWSDPSFLDRLKREPAAVFKEYDLPLFPDFDYAVRSGSGKPMVTLNVPPRPAAAGQESVGDITYEGGSARPKSCTNTCGF
ncbi:hypothetical protein [Myxococcus sp. RHSTA-1-4]|uniref:hypothetical protein n=1 Tax=Myxococcus sp. RHSTA-1-4 TaxID=2874601 RepID=UPI001CC132C0|nr:hypothetical protein [Myxococcus sp. RHSTA-1-4]MBZ4420623.1 hypothetical protein [Myxococcus sp. RHSTA-1-4]